MTNIYRKTLKKFEFAGFYCNIMLERVLKKLDCVELNAILPLIRFYVNIPF